MTKNWEVGKHSRVNYNTQEKLQTAVYQRSTSVFTYCLFPHIQAPLKDKGWMLSLPERSHGIVEDIGCLPQFPYNLSTCLSTATHICLYLCLIFTRRLCASCSMYFTHINLLSLTRRKCLPTLLHFTGDYEEAHRLLVDYHFK